MCLWNYRLPLQGLRFPVVLSSQLPPWQRAVAEPGNQQVSSLPRLRAHLLMITKLPASG